MKINENFLDLTTKQQKKPPFYPYKKKTTKVKYLLKKSHNLQNWFPRVKNSSREGDGVTGFHLSIYHCT